MNYKIIDQDMGQKMARSIWNIFLDKDPDLFVTPYGNRHLRYRCYFDTDKTIYLHLTNQEKAQVLENASQVPHEIFLYGAFNQVYVKQIKIFGSLSSLNTGGIIRQSIYDRLINDECGNDKLPLTPNKEEITYALKSIQEGTFFKFKPVAYELGEYETG